MSARKLKGYAVKLVGPEGKVLWVASGGATTPNKRARLVSPFITIPLQSACDAIDRMDRDEVWKPRIVAIYSKPKRTAAEERARVVKYLNSEHLELTALEIEEGAHWKADVPKTHIDTDAPQLEALGKADGFEILASLWPCVGGEAKRDGG